MALNKRTPPNKELSFCRNAGPYNISFTAAAVTPCVGVVQDEGLVLGASGVTRTGFGTYLITLVSRFYRIQPVGCNVQLTGNCVGCPSAQATLKQGIERRLKSRIPQVSRVESPQL